MVQTRFSKGSLPFSAVHLSLRQPAFSFLAADSDWPIGLPPSLGNSRLRTAEPREQERPRQKKQRERAHEQASERREDWPLLGGRQQHFSEDKKKGENKQGGSAQQRSRLYYIWSPKMLMLMKKQKEKKEKEKKEREEKERKEKEKKEKEKQEKQKRANQF
ncbi:stress response protein NST1-like isoform X1 [Sceloporus undulatus]|uniref:stress response protein NST1-like isoform X1 n=1 Tax=Sceloporus undulatus TaxID=8520 RepID=UPI001C4D9F36|nr:stress response protein NST1-like isoform X1 [Sceloporus undulatus]